MATAEDVVIENLRWARRKDLDDVVKLLAVSGSTLDWAYVRRWTDSHGTSGLLDQLRGDRALALQRSGAERSLAESIQSADTDVGRDRVRVYLE